MRPVLYLIELLSMQMKTKLKKFMDSIMQKATKLRKELKDISMNYSRSKEMARPLPRKKKHVFDL